MIGLSACTKNHTEKTSEQQKANQIQESQNENTNEKVTENDSESISEQENITENTIDSNQNQKNTAAVDVRKVNGDIIYRSGYDLAGDSNPELMQLIEQNMDQIQSLNGRSSRYTVYIKNLNDPEKMAYISNWSPAHNQFSASTIKLFILISVFQKFADGSLDKQDLYKLKQKDVVEGSGVMQYDPIGTEYTLEQLCELMISKSDNVATNVLIDEVGGFDAVNKVIASLYGPDHYSNLERKMMDTSNIENGKSNRINAKEAGETLLKLYQGDVISNSVDTEMLKLLTQTENKTKLPSLLPANAIVYNKTGESNYRGIENDIALIEINGQVFVICCLSELNGDDEEPEDSTYEEDISQVKAIAGVGKDVTDWMIN